MRLVSGATLLLICVGCKASSNAGNAESREWERLTDARTMEFISPGQRVVEHELRDLGLASGYSELKWVELRAYGSIPPFAQGQGFLVSHQIGKSDALTGSFEISATYVGASVVPANMNINFDLDLNAFDRDSPNQTALHQSFVDKLKDPRIREFQGKGNCIVFGDIVNGRRKVTLSADWPNSGIPNPERFDRGYLPTFIRQGLHKAGQLVRNNVLTKGTLIAFDAFPMNPPGWASHEPIGGVRGVLIRDNHLVGTIEFAQSMSVSDGARTMMIYVKCDSDPNTIFQLDKLKNAGADFGRKEIGTPVLVEGYKPEAKQIGLSYHDN